MKLQLLLSALLTNFIAGAIHQGETIYLREAIIMVTIGLQLFDPLNQQPVNPLSSKLEIEQRKVRVRDQQARENSRFLNINRNPKKNDNSQSNKRIGQPNKKRQ